MPLNARKITHIETNRARIRAGREEYVTLVTHSSGVTGYQAVPCVWHEAGKVPAGVADRLGRLVGKPWDALAEFPETQTWSSALVLIARTPTATSAGVSAAEKYVVLDRIKIGLGVDASGSQGNRWLVKLRRLRYET